jgi:GNAT superfamily N-acetyltransferase
VRGSAPWHVEILQSHHDRSSFACGEPDLDRYLRQQAGQDQRRNLGITYVAAHARVVLGYYTLSTGSVECRLLPPGAGRRVPYSKVPVLHLGRLAVDVRMHGKGLGARLLLDALTRAFHLSSLVGLHAVEVHALHARAALFYAHMGFVALPGDPLVLYLPMKSVRQLVMRYRIPPPSA